MPKGWTQEDEAELKAIEEEALAATEEPDDSGPQDDQPETDSEGEQPEEEEPKDETSPESSPGEKPEPTTEVDEDAELINNPNLSRKTRKRLQDLSKKAKENEALRARIAELEGTGKKVDQPAGDPPADEEGDPYADALPDEPGSKKSNGLPWDDEKEELTAEDVRALARQEAAEIAERQRMINDFATTLQTDCREMQTKYPQLDVDSEKYNPKLDQRIAHGYQIALKTYPKLRFKKYVETEMDAILSLVDAGTADTATIIKQQAEEQPLPVNSGSGRGGSGKLTTKDLDGMTLEEMERSLPKAPGYENY